MKSFARFTFLLSLLGLAWSAIGIAKPVFADVTFTVWDFEGEVITPSLDVTGNGVAASGSGLAGESFPAGNGSTDSWSFTNWSTGVLDVNDYFQFRVDMTNYGHLKLGFGERRSNTGIRDFEVHYSTDGTNFTLLPGTATNVPDNANFRTHSWEFPYNSPTDIAIRGQSTVYFRVYGYTSESAAGTWRIDDVTVAAVTNPTAVTLSQTGAQTAALPTLPFAFAFLMLAVASLAIGRRQQA